MQTNVNSGRIVGWNELHTTGGVEIVTDDGRFLRKASIFTRGYTGDRTMRQINKSRGELRVLQ